ncbi:MAG: hypothetical protein AAF889_01630 [Cyanobacteria bacterium P01_D01_bin.73]
MPKSLGAGLAEGVGLGLGEGLGLGFRRPMVFSVTQSWRILPKSISGNLISGNGISGTSIMPLSSGSLAAGVGVGGVSPLVAVSVGGWLVGLG